MIHFFKLFDKNIVLDVNSSSVHELDEPAYMILSIAGCEKWPAEGLSRNSNAYIQTAAVYGDCIAAEAASELTMLKNAGLLYSEDVFENLAEETIQKRINDPVIKAMCLHVSHDCNLRCRYCFAETGHFGGERLNMPPDVAVRAIDFLIRNSYGKENLEVDFFGGEPLLAMDTVKAAVNHARKAGTLQGKKFSFTITTNATLLTDEIAEYINENMDNLVLSIDGRPEVHDYMRIFPDKSGSYSSAAEKALKLLKSRGDKLYYTRGTFTKKNLDFAKDVLHMSQLGFKSISVEPVVADSNAPYAISSEDIPIICDEYEKLAAAYVKMKKEDNDFVFFHFEVDLDQGPCLYKRVGGCGSGVEYVAVTPEGDIYPCHQFAGNKNYIMGNIDSGIQKHDIREKFAKNNIYTVIDCKNCWAKFLCSGGCAAAALNYGGGIDKPYTIGCILERKRLECALWIKAAEPDI